MVRSFSSFGDGYLNEYLNDQAAKGWRFKQLICYTDNTTGYPKFTLILGKPSGTIK